VEPKSVKKDGQVVNLFMLLGSAGAKAVRKYVGEIDPRCHFPFENAFFALQ